VRPLGALGALFVNLMILVGTVNVTIIC